MEFGRIPWGSERATNRTSAKSTRIADESCGHGRRRRSRTSPHPLRLEDVGPADRAEPSPLSIGRWLVTFKLCRSRSAIQIPVLQFGGRNALVCNRDASRIPRSLTGSKKPHGFQEASRLPRTGRSVRLGSAKVYSSSNWGWSMGPISFIYRSSTPRGSSDETGVFIAKDADLVISRPFQKAK